MFVQKCVMGANSSNIRIETPIKNLEFHIYAGIPANSSMAGVLADIDPVHLEVVKQTTGGSITVLQKTKLIDLFELSQVNGGLLQGEITSSSYTIQCAVELSDFGAIPLQNGEFFEVNITGNSSIDEISLYAVDHPETAEIHNVYEKYFINPNSPREIEISSVKALGFPGADLDKVEFTFPNGKRISYTTKELNAIMRDELECRSVFYKYTGAAGEAEDGTLVNWNRNLVIPVHSATAVKVYANAAFSMNVLKYETL